MNENWIPYMRASDNGPWSCMIDVQHRRRCAAGDPQRPCLTIVHVAMANPGAEGLGDHGEAASLDETFEEPAQELGQIGGVFVARSRGQGRMSYCVYSPGDRGTDI